MDTNKGDDDLENYRSRLVAQEFRCKSEDSLFAATPLLESLEVLINIFSQEVYDEKDKLRATEGSQHAGIMLINIKRIFLRSCPATDLRRTSPRGSQIRR